MTGELVPDPNAKLEYNKLVDPKEAKWPKADFIIGNPPFMGQFRQREAFGDGYVDALRATYSEVPDSADFVVYWWYKAAKEVAEGRTIRAGFITTQSITQKQNRQVVIDAEARGARVVWAIADHYWNDGSDDARVRVAMTVIAKDPIEATLITVNGDAQEIASVQVPRLNADLSAHADVPTAAAIPLKANEGLSSPGFKLAGAGFIVEAQEAKRILEADKRLSAVLKPYRNGKDFTAHPRNVFLIDFGLMSESEARSYPMLFDIVRDRVKPERDAKSNRALRESWWRLERPREQLREALRGLGRYIVTPETSKHRLFDFVGGDTASDNSLIVIPSASAFLLGVLSSSQHVAWALAAGSRLGIDGTPRYNKGTCFEAFPFPDPSNQVRDKIASVAERIDNLRKNGLARSGKVGMTVMYNVVDKLRVGARLSKLEQEVHRFVACGTLRDLHDELDLLVAEAYGWPWPEPSAKILDRLVDLHDRRVEEERAGTVRWLRPEYQRPRYSKDAEAKAATDAEPTTKSDVGTPPSPWPADAVGQITALHALVLGGPITVDEAMSRFVDARREIVARHLETLAILGEVRALGEERYAVAIPAR